MNVDGYYNSLLTFIDKTVDEGFVTPAARHIIVSAPTAQDLLSKLEVVIMEYSPPYMKFYFSDRRAKLKSKCMAHVHLDSNNVYYGHVIINNKSDKKKKKLELKWSLGEATA